MTFCVCVNNQYYIKLQASAQPYGSQHLYIPAIAAPHHNISMHQPHQVSYRQFENTLSSPETLAYVNQSIEDARFHWNARFLNFFWCNCVLFEKQHKNEIYFPYFKLFCTFIQDSSRQQPNNQGKSGTKQGYSPSYWTAQS